MGERTGKDERYRSGRKPLALSGEEYAWRGAARDLCRLFWGLRRPALRVQEFGYASRLPLPHGARSARDAAVSTALSLSGEGREARQAGRDGGDFASPQSCRR